MTRAVHGQAFSSGARAPLRRQAFDQFMTIVLSAALTWVQTIFKNTSHECWECLTDCVDCPGTHHGAGCILTSFRPGVDDLLLSGVRHFRAKRRNRDARAFAFAVAVAAEQTAKFWTPCWPSTRTASRFFQPSLSRAKVGVAALLFTWVVPNGGKPVMTWLP